MENRNAIGKRLEELCKQKGISCKELAKKIDMPERRMLRIAWGYSTSVNIFTAMDICDGLGITLDEFLGTEEIQELRKFRKENMGRKKELE